MLKEYRKEGMNVQNRRVWVLFSAEDGCQIFSLRELQLKRVKTISPVEFV